LDSYTSLISDDERHRRERAVNFARASIGLEGFIPSNAEEAHARRFINGEIELADFIQVKADANPSKAMTPDQHKLLKAD